MLNDSVPSDHDNEREKETSPEESALQELERATAKLTARTRNCFRDSLYRLAENSKKQTVNQHQNGDHVVEKNLVKIFHDNALRVGETRESKTNAIDRAIASLMFTKMDLCAEESPRAATLDFLRVVNETTEPLQYSLDKLCSYSFTMLAGDAEVPTIGEEKLLPQTTNLHRDFSGCSLKILSRH